MEIYFILVASFLSSALCEHITSKCHGNNYMNSICPNSSEVIVIKQLQYGAKLNGENCPQNEQHNNNTCCSHEYTDCLKDVTDYANKYLYFSRLSGQNGISQNTATPWIRMECGNRTYPYSDYVQVVFDCTKVSEIKNLCDYQKMTSTNGGLYLHREQHLNIKNTCECMIISSESSTINVFAVDLRLQPQYPVNENLTGDCTNATNILKISDNINMTSIECENDTIYGELEKLYSSSENSINISYSENGKEPQSV
ncbi:uncharacterized protein LOC134232823 [Saccostrea cucullata]|uniref:uncharacterized protein LOC134232823 n=1 Tax=Saccostrea cuccullata TaxID=36930 RepID=UPI002ED4DC41